MGKVIHPRMSSVDALRGISLLGILCTHSVVYFQGMLPKIETLMQGNLWEVFVKVVVGLFFSGKFFMIFSFLFGLSFFFFCEKNSDERLFWRRTLFLLIIGLIDYVFYLGDILLPYAIFTPLLFGLRSLKDRYLLILVAFLFSGFPRLVIFISSKFFSIEMLDYSSESFHLLQSQYAELIQYASFLDLARFQIQHWPDIISFFQFGFLGRGYQILGLFVLGYLAGRNGFLNLLEKNSLLLKIYLKRCVLFLSCLTILSFITIGSNISIEKINGLTLIGLTLYDWFNLSFSFLILLLFIKIYPRISLNPYLSKFHQVGRMSLSVYISQNIFFTWLYMGWGKGWINQVSITTSLVLGLLFFVIQVCFAEYWLRFFHYGPLEWVWRSVTYGKCLHFTRKSN